MGAPWGTGTKKATYPDKRASIWTRQLGLGPVIKELILVGSLSSFIPMVPPPGSNIWNLIPHGGDSDVGLYVTQILNDIEASTKYIASATDLFLKLKVRSRLDCSLFRPPSLSLTFIGKSGPPDDI